MAVAMRRMSNGRSIGFACGFLVGLVAVILAAYECVVLVMKALFWKSHGSNISQLTQPLVIPLRRVDARNDHKDTTHFYVGTIKLGTPPQEFDMMFDTGSHLVWVVHGDCQDKACVEHKQYTPSKSDTAIDADRDGQPVRMGFQFAQNPEQRLGMSLEYNQSDLGSGAISMVMMRDMMCIGDTAPANFCVDQGFFAAKAENEVPFRAMPNDGIVGLIPDSGSMPFYSFFTRVLDDDRRERNVAPHISLFYGAKGGEVRIGGYDESKFKGPLTWIQPYERGGYASYWQFALKRVLIGDAVVDPCEGGCKILVDSGVWRIGAMEKQLESLRSFYKKGTTEGGACPDVTLRFELESGKVMEFGPKKFISKSDCEPMIGLIKYFPKTYTFGGILFRHYYMTFDYKTKAIGYAPLSESAEGLA